MIEFGKALTIDKEKSYSLPNLSDLIDNDYKKDPFWPPFRPKVTDWNWYKKMMFSEKGI